MAHKNGNLMAGITGGFISLLIALLMGTTFTYTYDNATPVGTDAPSTLDDQDRNTKLANHERQNVDHYWQLTGTQVSDAATGEHRKISFHSQIANPTNAADKGWLFMKDVAANTELFWEDELGNVLQLTNVGTLAVTSSDLLGTLANNTYLTGVDFAGTGTVDLIKADANDVAVVPDNSQTATNAAPTSTTGIANKKYVDDQATAVWTPSAYTGGESMTFPNGRIEKQGTTSGAQQTSGSVTFAVPFPTSNVRVFMFPVWDSIDKHSFPMQLRAKTAAGFTFNQPNAGAAYTSIEWMAIGY